MDVHQYNNYIGSKAQAQRLPLWLWFDLNSGIYLVISYNAKLYNITIVYLYNNNLTSVKPPCSRRESLDTAHIYISNNFIVLFCFHIGMGREDCGI